MEKKVLPNEWNSKLGHIVYRDNFYSNVELHIYFLVNGVAVCGTVRGKRKRVPSEMKIIKQKK